MAHAQGLRRVYVGVAGWVGVCVAGCVCVWLGGWVGVWKVETGWSCIETLGRKSF